MERRWSFLQRTMRRLRFGEPVVVVSGLPRSGTSMIMQMVMAGGMKVLTDRRRQADEDNPRGYFEDERVKSLHEDEDRSWLREARGRAIKVVSYHLEYLPADLSYRAVFVQRDLAEVIASQNRMLQRRGESVEEDDGRTRELLEKHLRKVRFFLAGAAHIEVLDLPHRLALEQPQLQAARLAAFLGGSLDRAAMAGAVERKLYRNRAPGHEVREPAQTRPVVRGP